MIHLSLTLDDCKEDEWVYSMQYMGRIFRATSPQPLEAMSVLEQEALVTYLLSDAFNGFREKKLMQRPEDAFEEGVNKLLESEGYDPEEEEEDYSDIPTEDLWNELERRRRESEGTEE